MYPLLYESCLLQRIVLLNFLDSEILLLNFLPSPRFHSFICSFSHSFTRTFEITSPLSSLPRSATHTLCYLATTTLLTCWMKY